MSRRRTWPWVRGGILACTLLPASCGDELDPSDSTPPPNADTDAPTTTTSPPAQITTVPAETRPQLDTLPPTEPPAASTTEPSDL